MACTLQYRMMRCNDAAVVEEMMMRSIIAVVALVAGLYGMLRPALAHAGSCVRIGAIVKCSDGSSGTQLGDLYVVQGAPDPMPVPQFVAPTYAPVAPQVFQPVPLYQAPAIRAWGGGR